MRDNEDKIRSCASCINQFLSQFIKSALMQHFIENAIIAESSFSDLFIQLVTGFSPQVRGCTNVII